MKKNSFVKLPVIFICIYLLLFKSLFLVGKARIDKCNNFKSGSEILLDSIYLLENKRVALITNHTGILPDGKHLIDALIDKRINVVRIFTPEHGFFADEGYEKKYKGIEVISLYNNDKNIKDEYLQDLDILIYDIQDLGVRFYTYTSTLYLTMKDAFRNNIDFIICDRPAMHNLNYVSGFFLEERFSSFVGLIPTPICYGMTTGELGACLKSIIDSYPKTLNLKVMKMQGYNRNIDYENLNFKWVNPSPNIRNLESARLYPALCFLEGTNFSEGRGTEIPFTLFGAPFCNNEVIFNELYKYNLPGLDFERVEFTPLKYNQQYTPKYCNEKCYGVKIILKDFFKYKPMETAIAILITLKKFEKNFKWTNNNFIDKLAGTDKLRKMIDNNESYDNIISYWTNDVERFINQIDKFLFY